MAPNSGGYVYAAQTKDLAIVKIGFTKNVRQRLDTLNKQARQRGIANLHFLGFVRGTRDVEAQTLSHFSGQELAFGKEWFKATQEILNAVSGMFPIKPETLGFCRHGVNQCEECRRAVLKQWVDPVYAGRVEVEGRNCFLCHQPILPGNAYRVRRMCAHEGCVTRPDSEHPRDWLKMCFPNWSGNTAIRCYIRQRAALSPAFRFSE